LNYGAHHASDTADFPWFGCLPWIRGSPFFVALLFQDGATEDFSQEIIKSHNSTLA
jgi:hypothetical protein